jgi:hypothetical protein
VPRLSPEPTRATQQKTRQKILRCTGGMVGIIGGVLDTPDRGFGSGRKKRLLLGIVQIVALFWVNLFCSTAPGPRRKCRSGLGSR